MDRKYTIGFIFLNEIHHINHFITVAIELSKTNNISIITFPEVHEYLHTKLLKLGGEKVKIEKLQTNWLRAFTDKLKKRTLPRNNFWFKKNSPYIIKNFDAIIFTGFTHQNFIKWKKDKKKFPKLIKIPHGFIGRDHGYFKFYKDFDFQLLYGDFDVNFLNQKKLLGKYTKIGYPKIDALTANEEQNLFNNNKKTVIYCPHFSPNSTSWNFHGLQILEYFENQDEYNLIFAPHLNLFLRLGGEDISKIPTKFFNSKKILIDLGSVKSVDMNYINAADIYLGDISSQVYEFILNLRPCIFINSEKIDYKNNIHYRFWQCGEIIENVTELNSALQNSQKLFEEQYQTIQRKINSENFYIQEDSTASERAANAINQFVHENC